jgi:hypothetical protein
MISGILLLDAAVMAAPLLENEYYLSQRAYLVAGPVHQ